jgi:sugar diacid utilization regulator
VPVDLPSGHAADLVAAGGETLDEEGLRLLQIGASAVAVLLASERSVAEAELRSRGEFVHALLTAGTDAPSLGRRARALGIDLRSVRTVAVLEPGAGDPAAAARFGAHVTTAHRGWSASHAGGIVLLLPEAVDVVRESVRRIAAADGEAPTTGLAPVTQAGSDGHRGADAPDGIRQGYEHARQTAAVLLALDRAGTCATSEELGFYRSLFSRAGRAELAAFIRLTIGPLLDYDAAHQRDLAATLEVYLEQSRHHARTCQVMHIHSNTLYQRLDRVTEVLGPGWKDPGTALEVQVALRLGRLLSTWADRA